MRNYKLKCIFAALCFVMVLAIPTFSACSIIRGLDDFVPCPYNKFELQDGIYYLTNSSLSNFLPNVAIGNNSPELQDSINIIRSLYSVRINGGMLQFMSTNVAGFRREMNVINTSTIVSQVVFLRSYVARDNSIKLSFDFSQIDVLGTLGRLNNILLEFEFNRTYDFNSFSQGVSASISNDFFIFSYSLQIENITSLTTQYMAIIHKNGGYYLADNLLGGSNDLNHLVQQGAIEGEFSEEYNWVVGNFSSLCVSAFLNGSGDYRLYVFKLNSFTLDGTRRSVPIKLNIYLPLEIYVDTTGDEITNLRTSTHLSWISTFSDTTLYWGESWNDGAGIHVFSRGNWHLPQRSGLTSIRLNNLQQRFGDFSAIRLTRGQVENEENRVSVLLGYTIINKTTVVDNNLKSDLNIDENGIMQITSFANFSTRNTLGTWNSNNIAAERINFSDLSTRLLHHNFMALRFYEFSWQLCVESLTITRFTTDNRTVYRHVSNSTQQVTGLRREGTALYWDQQAAILWYYNNSDSWSGRSHGTRANLNRTTATAIRIVPLNSYAFNARNNRLTVTMGEPLFINNQHPLWPR